MSIPVSNNLQEHLNFATRNHEFIPDRNAVLSSIEAQQNSHPTPPGTQEKPLEVNNNQTSTEIDFTGPDPTLNVPKKRYMTDELLLSSDCESIPESIHDSDSDSDFEALVSCRKASFENFQPVVQEVRELQPSALPEPNSPPHSEMQIPQTPRQPVLEPAYKKEPGSLFSEKITLLEQKIKYLESLLEQNNIVADTKDIDDRLNTMENKIDLLAEENVVDLPDSDCLALYSTPPHPFLGSDNTLSSGDGDDMEIESVENVRKGPPSSPSVCFSQSSQSQMHPWTRDVKQILLKRFGLSKFRHNQADAVNETLAGNDVVVLMPTGGGKSLCYQLPALVSSGNTKGITLVISPLISLMQDQVYHLKNRNIKAEMLNSKLSASERNSVFSKLSDGKLELLYLSPEMLSVSGKMKSILQQLYNQQGLARIVIDEAHCVSSWGHDFRPDYMELSKMKFEFPSIPIMALTATANDRVLLDIVNCLRPNPKILKQSFNRENLIYEVRQKTQGVINDIYGICRSFDMQSGIIYCNSKKNCEDTASKLCGMGVNASFYHAGMDQESRASVQTEWQKGITQVVCATIAFGMGIDKPDVRYVVHLTIPRNMEGFYQETGRAGRDGKKSYCILFYSYGDVSMLQKLISNDKDLQYATREHHKSLLLRVMQYCENKTDCRRKQILQYFNEDFEPGKCGYGCDNCLRMKNRKSQKLNMTLQAIKAINVVSNIVDKNKITVQQFIDILKGRVTSKVKQCRFNTEPWFGCLKDETATMIERLVHTMLSEKVIEEFSMRYKSRFPQSYVRTGPNSSYLVSGTLTINLETDVPIQTDTPGNSNDTEFRKRARASLRQMYSRKR